MGNVGRRVLVVAAIIGVTAVGFRAPAQAAVKKPTLWVYGDSITWESTPSIKPTVRQFKTTFRAYYALAVCDLLGLLKADLVKYAKHPPADVVLETAGNSWGTCMTDPETGHPYPFGSPGYYERYDADIAEFAQVVENAGARLLFGAPPTSSEAWFNDIEDHLVADEQATGNPVAFGPSNAVAPGGTFAERLPCMAGETTHRGCAGGTIQVRNSDGLHFCPIAFDFEARKACDVYASGEHRFGPAFGAAVDSAF